MGRVAAGPRDTGSPVNRTPSAGLGLAVAALGLVTGLTAPPAARGASLPSPVRPVPAPGAATVSEPAPEPAPEASEPTAPADPPSTPTDGASAPAEPGSETRSVTADPAATQPASEARPAKTQPASEAGSTTTQPAEPDSEARPAKARPSKARPARARPARARSAKTRRTSTRRASTRRASTRTDSEPHDPNDRPPLPPPNGQPAPDSLRRDIDHTTDASSRDRVVLTLAPVFASFRLPFLGRPSVPVRGGGVAFAARVALWRGIGARLSASHTVHAAYDEYTRDDDSNLVQTAARGLIQGTHAGLSVTYTMDLGRLLTTLDAGAGGMWIRSPDAVQDGQLGGSCRPEGVCDTGLVCSAEEICRVGITPQVHGGFAADVLLGDRFTVGAELRYFALITAPTSYPVYLVAALRAGLRF